MFNDSNYCRSWLIDADTTLMAWITYMETWLHFRVLMTSSDNSNDNSVLGPLLLTCGTFSIDSCSINNGFIN